MLLVRFGDKFILEVWKIGEFKGEWEEIRFLVKNSYGKVVLSNGWVFIKIGVKGKL